jgi:oxygen-independent coproporphyrinogen-3 oxidase
MFSQLPSEDTQLEHLLFIDQFMRAKGFEHYEISNFARPGRRARHNLNYWTGQSYLGLGPSAHSFDAKTQRRWKNVSSLHKYAELLATNLSPIERSEQLTPEQIDLEKWMLALRLDDGFPANWLKTKSQIARAESLLEQGLIEPHPTRISHLRLTARGFALSDHVIGSLA